MRPVSLRVNTLTGAWLSNRARRLAASIVKRRVQGATEVIDGYLVRASHAGPVASASVIDTPGMVTVARGTSPIARAMRAGQRDSFNSRAGITDGPYSADEVGFAYLYGASLGFDWQAEDEVLQPNKFRHSAPFQDYGYHMVKREAVRANFLGRYPITSIGLPIPYGTELFTGATTIGRAGRRAPGIWIADHAIEQLTDGYGLARIADMQPFGTSYPYQGDAPVSCCADGRTLMVVPVVRNGPIGLPDAAVHWGEVALLFVLFEHRENSNVTVVLSSQLWRPSELECDFFHQGPWLTRPEYPRFGSVIPPKPEFMTAWDYWWGADTLDAKRNTGMRPLWFDGLTVGWFGGKFVVTARASTINGVYTPRSEDITDTVSESYYTALGQVDLRFEVDTAGVVTCTEGAHEIWDAADDSDSTPSPYSRWVVGLLDEDVIRHSLPLATVTSARWMARVFLRFEASRKDIWRTGHDSDYWKFFFSTMHETARIELCVQRLDADGGVLPEVVSEIAFSDIGCGIDAYIGAIRTSAVTGLDTEFVHPPAPYKRARECLFVALSNREIAFVAREAWHPTDIYSLSMRYPLKLVVVDIESGAVEVRSESPLTDQYMDMPWGLPHLDCVQQVIYGDSGEVVIEGVLLLTGNLDAKTYISRDSGMTWTLYIDNHDSVYGYGTWAYYIGNDLGGGIEPGFPIRKQEP